MWNTQCYLDGQNLESDPKFWKKKIGLECCTNFATDAASEFSALFYYKKAHEKRILARNWIESQPFPSRSGFNCKCYQPNHGTTFFFLLFFCIKHFQNVEWNSNSRFCFMQRHCAGFVSEQQAGKRTSDTIKTKKRGLNFSYAAAELAANIRSITVQSVWLSLSNIGQVWGFFFFLSSLLFLHIEQPKKTRKTS